MKPENTFEETIKKTSSLLYTLSYRLTGSPDEAEDLMQDTYIKAYHKWHQVKNRDNPLPWLRKICLNIFIDNYRKHGSRNRMKITPFPADDHDIAAGSLTPEQEFLFDEEVQKIRSQCYTILSTSLCLNQRISFVLVDIFRLSIDDVSQLTGKSASAVKSLLHRARNRMNRFLGPSCGLVNPENICKCRSWISLAHDVEKRREHLQSIIRQANPLLDPGPSRAKLITLFRTLPYLNPPEKYLEDLEPAGKKNASLP